MVGMCGRGGPFTSWLGLKERKEARRIPQSLGGHIPDDSSLSTSYYFNHIPITPSWELNL
jgi:hypothetical protein